MVSQTRREFLKLGLAAAASAAAASGIEIPLLGNQNSNLQSQLNGANTQVASLKKQLNTVTGFVSLNLNEQSLLEAVVETIIPSDSTGPGAKEAGVIYFIDRALAGDYGQSANMFMDAPHVLPKIPASTTNTLAVSPSLSWVNWASAPGNPFGYTGGNSPIVYQGGDIGNQGSGQGITATPRVGSGINYQYPLNMREFWRVGLDALQNYAKDTNAPYKGTFESLSASN